MATTQQRLDSAIASLDALMTGTAKVQVTVGTGVGTRSVTFTRATVAQLERYIASLRAELAGRSPTRNRTRYVMPFDS